MKREAFNHSKLAFLADLLDCDLCDATGILSRLWHLAAEETPAGDIGKLSNNKIRSGIGSRRNADKLIAALLESGWLDEHPEYRLVIHDWSDHCEDSVHNKIARAHSFFVDGTAPKTSRVQTAYKASAERFYAQNVRTQPAHNLHTNSSSALKSSSCSALPCTNNHVPDTTVPDPPIVPPVGGNTHGATSAPSAKPTRAAKQAPPEIEPHWSEFVAAYPPRDGNLCRAEGQRIFARLAAKGEDLAAIVRGARGYRRHCDDKGSTGGPYVKQIPSWLNGRCWEEWMKAPDQGVTQQTRIGGPINE